MGGRARPADVDRTPASKTTVNREPGGKGAAGHWSAVWQEGLRKGFRRGNALVRPRSD